MIALSFLSLNKAIHMPAPFKQEGIRLTGYNILFFKH